MEKCYFSIIFLVFALSLCVDALNNGLALTPPMGWSSWGRFACGGCKEIPDECLSEQLIRKQADLMVSEGYLEAGYEYVIIEDVYGVCWQAKDRDEKGRMVADPDRFPNGIKALADYVHGKGLKFGIVVAVQLYNDSIFYYLERDAKTLAEWHVDYVKLDGWCNNCDMDKAYIRMGNYLNATGRPIVYSCTYPYYEEFRLHHQPDYATAAKFCNLWRNYHLIQNSWNTVIDTLHWYGHNQNRISKFAGPGHWNYPHLLIIGNSGLSFEQCKAQMALWAIMASPLIMSTDLGAIDPRYKAILLNKDVIAINQDKLGIQGCYITTINGIEIWMKQILPRTGNYYSHAIAFLSSNILYGSQTNIEITLSQLGLEYTGGYVVESLFDDVNPISRLLQRNETIVVMIKSGDVVLLRARPMC